MNRPSPPARSDGHPAHRDPAAGSAPRRRPRRTAFGAWVALLPLAPALLLAVACGDDGTGPDPFAGQVGVVVNSVDLSLSIFEPGMPDGPVRTVGLGADGSPVGLSLRGGVAAVPMGIVPALAVVDVETATLVRSVALPEGSGATGSAFLNDSVVLVANPGRNSVTPVNVRSGAAGAEVAVGTYPQAVVVTAGRAFVVNANLVDFAPAGPGSLTVLDAETLAAEGEIALSGTNPGGAVVGPGGRLWVVHSGTFGGGDGSLSVVDPDALAETAHHEGFGEFPFAAAFGPEGTLFVGSFSYGVAIWDPAGEAFVRGPADAVTPEGVPSVSGLGFDGGGRLHVLRPSCQEPSAVLRLDAAFAVADTVDVGTCPIALAFGPGADG